MNILKKKLQRYNDLKDKLEFIKSFKAIPTYRLSYIINVERELGNIKPHLHLDVKCDGCDLAFSNCELWIETIGIK